MRKKVISLMLIGLFSLIAYSLEKSKTTNSSSITVAAESDFFAVIDQISNHIIGTSTLTTNQITSAQLILETNIELLESNNTAISEALELVNRFETIKGPLFVQGSTTQGGFSRTATGLELENFMLYLQQSIMDYSYSKENLTDYPEIFSNTKYETSSYFPGSVAPPANENVSYTVKINGKHVRNYGTPANYETEDARRPTGCYLAPGSVAKVTVPNSLVGIGASVLVGAHTWDHTVKPNIRRIERATIKYEITSATTIIANPLGGGVYINIPFEHDLGIIDVTLQNVVRSPYYANTVANKTSLSEWQNTERLHSAPWADFETDKVMMQVPTSWIYAMDDPSQVMDDWDMSMDAISEMLGRPLLRSKTVVYHQVDVQSRGYANFPGYPFANTTYSPFESYNGDHDHFMTRGVRDHRNEDGTVVFFHELGHAEKIYKFDGEVESFVNFLYAAVVNKKFGVDLEVAFEESSTTTNKHTIDEAAISWMIAENFRLGNPMSSQAGQYRQEFHYQPRGYAKYGDIVRLFGWEALEKFYQELNDSYENGTYEYTGNVNYVPTDGRVLRMSTAAGYDLRPLLHFWGKIPDNPTSLAASIEQSGVKQSAAIYDKLVYYKSLVPSNNTAFKNFGLMDYSESKILNYSDTNVYYENISQSYYEGFFKKWWNDYNEEEAQATVNMVQNIIDLYFPDGRPVDGGDFTPDPNKTYYIDSPHHNLRLAASGESENAYTTSTSTTGADVEWKFVSKGNGSWHLQRAAGGTKPRLRTDNTENADMQETVSSGVWTYYDISDGYIDNTYFLTLPDGPTNFKRLQIDNSGNVKMKSTSHAGTWESFTFTEAGLGSIFKIEAEEFDAMSGIQVEPNGQGTDNVGFINNGDWLRFDNINLTNITLIDAHVSSDTSGGTIEYRLGSTTGTLIGSVNVSGTGSWHNWETVSANVGSFSGTTDLYLVFKGNDGYLFNVDWIELSNNSTGSKDILGSESADKISIYPNPVTNTTTVVGMENSVLTIYDMNGRVVFEKVISSKNEIIDLSDLSTGVYYAKANNLILSVRVLKN